MSDKPLAEVKLHHDHSACGLMILVSSAPPSGLRWSPCVSNIKRPLLLTTIEKRRVFNSKTYCYWRKTTTQWQRQPNKTVVLFKGVTLVAEYLRFQVSSNVRVEDTSSINSQGDVSLNLGLEGMESLICWSLCSLLVFPVIVALISQKQLTSGVTTFKVMCASKQKVANMTGVQLAAQRNKLSCSNQDGKACLQFPFSRETTPNARTFWWCSIDTHLVSSFKLVKIDEATTEVLDVTRCS